ncbi:hypothetical protein GALMADRAFT_696724 [Galerina marginata CBS 339.88]|uniref:GP-PDE domain-containing protein n=1 Tax=Galerina marginata (strain CBS 339.88) TaxID=685588 RepID=A0A067TVX3_GALM3|nr:hypothetical protein GALMADRAFT_696724 [Galerina marginata CBS 339.88]
MDITPGAREVLKFKLMSQGRSKKGRNDLREKAESGRVSFHHRAFFGGMLLPIRRGAGLRPCLLPFLSPARALTTTTTIPRPSFSVMSVTPSRTLPDCWGHRGASSRFPENTLASFEAAIRDGSEGIESGISCWRIDPSAPRNTPHRRPCFQG